MNTISIEIRAKTINGGGVGELEIGNWNLVFGIYRLYERI
jgi:hypothetical protein